MTVNNVDRFNKLKDRLIRRTGSAGMTSFAGGNKVSMSLAEYERLVTYAEWNKTTMDKSAYEAMLNGEHPLKNPYEEEIRTNLAEHNKNMENFLKGQGTQSVIVPNAPVVFTQNPERARDAEQVLRLIEIIKETGGAVEIQGVRIEPIEQVERRVK